MFNIPIQQFQKLISVIESKDPEVSGVYLADELTLELTLYCQRLLIGMTDSLMGSFFQDRRLNKLLFFTGIILSSNAGTLTPNKIYQLMCSYPLVERGYWSREAAQYIMRIKSQVTDRIIAEEDNPALSYPYAPSPDLILEIHNEKLHLDEKYGVLPGSDTPNTSATDDFQVSETLTCRKH